MLTGGDVELEAARGAGIGAGGYVATSGQLAGHWGLLSRDGVDYPARTAFATASTHDDASR